MVDSTFVFRCDNLTGRKEINIRAVFAQTRAHDYYYHDYRRLLANFVRSASGATRRRPQTTTVHRTVVFDFHSNDGMRYYDIAQTRAEIIRSVVVTPANGLNDVRYYINFVLIRNPTISYSPPPPPSQCRCYYSVHGDFGLWPFSTLGRVTTFDTFSKAVKTLLKKKKNNNNKWND